MNNSEDTIVTPYRRLDKSALLELENTYDTRMLLKAVEQLDKVLGAARAQDGLRDMLLSFKRRKRRLQVGVGVVKFGVTKQPRHPPDVVPSSTNLVAKIRRSK